MIRKSAAMSRGLGLAGNSNIDNIETGPLAVLDILNHTAPIRHSEPAGTNTTWQTNWTAVAIPPSTTSTHIHKCDHMHLKDLVGVTRTLIRMLKFDINRQNRISKDNSVYRSLDRFSSERWRRPAQAHSGSAARPAFSIFRPGNLSSISVTQNVVSHPTGTEYMAILTEWFDCFWKYVGQKRWRW